MCTDLWIWGIYDHDVILRRPRSVLHMANMKCSMLVVA